MVAAVEWSDRTLGRVPFSDEERAIILQAIRYETGQQVQRAYYCSAPADVHTTLARRIRARELFW